MKWKKTLHALVAAWLIAAWISSCTPKDSVRTNTKDKIEKVLDAEKMEEYEIKWLAGLDFKMKIKWERFEIYENWPVKMRVDSVKVEPSNKKVYKKLIKCYWSEEKVESILEEMENNIKKTCERWDKERIIRSGELAVDECCMDYFFRNHKQEKDRYEKIMWWAFISLPFFLFWIAICLSKLETKYEKEEREEQEKKIITLKDKYLKYFEEKNGIDLNDDTVMEYVETLLPDIETMKGKIENIRKILEGQGMTGKAGWNNAEILWLLTEWKEFIESELNKANNDEATKDKLLEMRDLINEVLLLYGELDMDLSDNWIDFKTSKEIFASMMSDTTPISE